MTKISTQNISFNHNFWAETRKLVKNSIHLLLYYSIVVITTGITTTCRMLQQYKHFFKGTQDHPDADLIEVKKNTEKR